MIGDVEEKKMSNKQLYVISKCINSSGKNSTLHFNGYLEGKKNRAN